MKHLFLIAYSLIITHSILGQCKLTIIQEGNKANRPEVYAVNTYESPFRQINDSTIEYNVENITEPTYLFVLLDTVKHGDTNLAWNWHARLWLTPEINHRELIINYPTKTLKVKDFVKSIQTKELDGKTKIVSNNLPRWDSIAQRLDDLYRVSNDSEQVNIVTSYIERHPDSYLSLWLFGHTHAIYIESTDKKQALFNKLNPALQRYPDYQEAKNSFKSRSYPNPGDPLKEFILTDVNGKTFNSRTIKNKWILLHFWCNCCGPCVHEMDSMVSYYKTLDTSKIAFISVALDNDKAQWRKAATTHKIIWTNLWEPDNFYGDLCLTYNLQAMPYFVLFNSDKKLVITQDGSDALDTTIKGYLKSIK